jgi:hypothetical protein
MRPVSHRLSISISILCATVAVAACGDDAEDTEVDGAPGEQQDASTGTGTAADASSCPVADCEPLSVVAGQI